MRGASCAPCGRFLAPALLAFLLALAGIPCPAGEMAAVSRVGPFTNDTAFFEFPYEPFAPCSLSNALSGAFCGDGGPGSDVLLWNRPGETNAAVFCGSAWETVLGDGLVAAGDLFAFARCDSEEAGLFLLGLVPRTLSLLPPPPAGSPSIGSLSADAQGARVCVSSSGPVDLFSADSPGPTNVPPSGWAHVARAPASFSVSDGLPGADSTRFYAVSSPFLDSDLDGLGDLAERLVHGTDPHLADTDGDGCPDMAELVRGTSPLVPDAPPATLFSEGFERPLVVPGPLSGQNGWAAAAGAGVEETPLASGAACLRLSSGEGASASHAVAFPPGVSWLEAKVLAEAAAEPPPASGCIGVFFDFLGHPVALDGTAWRTNGAVSVEAESWARLAARIDRDAGEWDLYLDGAIAFRSLRTGPAAPSELAFGGGDGLVDDVSVSTSRPAGLSSDGDALPDEWEIAHFATLERDGSQDFDSDGLSDLEEFALGTDPLLADTDGDSMPDGWEAASGLDPLDPSDAALDPDGDGVSNLEEFALGLDPGSFEPDPRLRLPGLLASFWRTPGKLGAMPDFGSLMPSHSAVAARLDFPGQGWVPGVTPFGTNFACRLEGYLLVPADGKCTFWLKSNAGARMYIDGALALDDGESHSAHTVSASPALERGYRRVEIDFYANSSPGYLLLEWKPPGGERAKVPASALCHLPPAPDPWFGPGVDVEFHSFPSALSEMPALDGHAPCAARVWDRLDVRATQSAWEDGLPADRFAASAEGLLLVPVSARYEISLSSNEGSSLLLDGVPLVDNGGLHGMRARTAVLPLAAGYHPFRVEYFENAGSAGLSLGWSCRGCVSEPVPARFLFRRPAVMDTDGDGMPDWWEEERGLDPLDPSDAAADPDGDGLSNLAECRAWGDPRSPDTDGDGMPDAWEAANGTCPFLADALDDPDGDGLANVEEYLSGSTPTAVDTDGDGLSDYEERMQLGTDPTNADSVSVGAAVAAVRTGRSVALDVAEPRAFAVNAGLLHEWRDYGADKRPVAASNRVVFRVDGHFVAWRDVPFDCSNVVQAVFYTPVLPSGAHELSVEWCNPDFRARADLVSLSVNELSGVDFAEVVRRRNRAPGEVVRSRVSPAFVEGSARFPWLVSAGGLAVRPCGSGSWYADVPLSPVSGSEVAVCFEGLVSTNVTVEWEATDLFSGADGMVLRKGASLLLAGAPSGAQGGSVAVFTNGAFACSYAAGGAAALEFAFPGDWLVHAVWTPEAGEGVETGAISVRCVGGEFPSLPPACQVGRPRAWQCPGLSTDLFYETDACTHVAMSAPGEATLLVDDTRGERLVAARLFEGGPVLDVARVDPMWAVDSFGNVAYLVESADDHDRCRCYMRQHGASASVRFLVRAYTSSVLLDDYSLERWVDAASFDRDGIAWFELVKSKTMAAGCHTVEIFQDGVRIGEAVYGNGILPEELR